MVRFCAILLAAFYAFTVSLAAHPYDTLHTAPQGQSLLWKLSGKDLKKPSYLFGTIHLLCSEDYVWTQAMRRSFQQCEQVCFEMDMDDPNVMMDIGMGMIDHSGKTLREYFTKTQYDSLSLYFRDSLSLNISMFEQLKPAALLSVFAIKTALCSNPVSYETKIQEQSKKAKKEICGIEEPFEQIALLDSIPTDSIIAGIMETISGQDNEKNTYHALIKAYKRQDLPALDGLINDAGKNGYDISAFLDNRNKRWIARMEEQMEQRAIFFAVGAGHLWGDNGLISLLREVGYTVEPIR